MELTNTGIERQLNKYNSGKHTIVLLLNVIVLLGFSLEVTTLFSSYSPSHLVLQIFSIAILCATQVLFFINRKKYYSLIYVVVSYTVTINTLLNVYLFPDFAASTHFKSSDFFGRDMTYFFAIIAFIGFIAAPKHIIIQGLLTLGFITLHLVLQPNQFIYANAALYYVVTSGFILVMYYLMTNLNKFVNALSKSNAEILHLQESNLLKRERLERFNQAVIDLSRKNYPQAASDTYMKYVFEEVVQLVKKELNCHRVGLWLFEEQQDYLEKKILLTDEGYDLSSMRMKQSDYPVYFADIVNKSSYISAPDAINHPSTKEFKEYYLSRYQIYSMLDCPIKVNNKVLGVICCEHQNETKNWEQEEIFFIQSVSDYVAIQLKNVETDSLLQSIRSKNEEILKSISEMEKVQKKLVEAKEGAERANKAKSEFLANMSHEIRTPLNAVLGFSDLLKGKTIEPKYEKYLDGILTGGKNLLSLINDILDLSKIEAGHIELQNVSVDLKLLLKELSEIFAQKGEIKGLNFEIQYKGIELPKYIFIDETRIRQVLFNLLGNAFKFTHKGGVTLVVETLASSQKNKLDLIFRVIDTGIGIPDSQQSLIFEAFRQQDSQSTRKYGGTGLGLTITKRLVEILKGRIEISSEAGKGSVFTVSINDIAIVSAEKNNTINKETSLNFKGQTLMLIEDNESNRDLIKGYLEHVNLQIITAENGRVALDKMEQVVPDIILLDMMMPVMDGYTTALSIRSDLRLKHLPVLALTASVTKHGENSIRDLCNDYLRKPISKEELLQALGNYLDCEEVNKTSPLSLPESHNEDAYQLSSIIKEELGRKFLTEWENNSQVISLDKVINFARSLKEYGLSSNTKTIVTYADELLASAEDFDISKMNAVYSGFKLFFEEK